MTESERVALFDLDCSLADYEKAIAEKLAHIMSPLEQSLDWPELLAGEHPDWLKARLALIKREPGFWENLPLIPFGMEVYQMMGTLDYKRMILTKGPLSNPVAWQEKISWCAKHVPTAGVTITHDKGLVYGKVLYDDYPPYITRWLKWRPRGKVLMLDAPHNRDFSHPAVLRCYREDFPSQQEHILEHLGDL